MKLPPFFFFFMLMISKLQLEVHKGWIEVSVIVHLTAYLSWVRRETWWLSLWSVITDFKYKTWTIFGDVITPFSMPLQNCQGDKGGGSSDIQTLCDGLLKVCEFMEWSVIDWPLKLVSTLLTFLVISVQKKGVKNHQGFNLFIFRWTYKESSYFQFS